MEIVQIKNGYLIIADPQEPDKWVYSSDKADLHKEIEFFLSSPELPPPPLPPVKTSNFPRNEGVRQFSDED